MITSPINTAQVDTQAQAVSLSGIGKKYPQAHFADFWALRGISLNIGRQEVVGIIGRNGAGKTTLLNIIAGTLSPGEGNIRVFGKVMGLFNPGVGFQDELSGRENIFLNGAILGASRSKLSEKLNSIIEFSELGDFINMPLGTYSQGMRLRLGFSILANLEFDILVTDEVLAVGDALFQSKCFARLTDLRRAGKTLIITTQDMALIERLCDRVALLDHGRLLFYGDTREAVNRYRALLNTERFFVGPRQKQPTWVENTKKWADDLSGWGNKLGTEEAVIESVELRDKRGRRIDALKSREPLSIKVYFNARDNIKEPHFGIAIFRNDGVYCYGPNTAFDGCAIPALKRGRGYFQLTYKALLLAPGEYRLSVAIWDKNERLAFNYHEGCYPLTVLGKPNSAGELLNIPYKTSNSKFTFFSQGLRAGPDLNLLKDSWGRKSEAETIKIASVELLDQRGRAKEFFCTAEPAKLIINFSPITNFRRGLFLWIGLYRDDGIYCQGITQPLKRQQRRFKIIFPRLPLLPGGYRISAGVWDSVEKKFILCHHGVYPLRMVFEREDHGTLYLEHKWEWGEVRQ